MLLASALFLVCAGVVLVLRYIRTHQTSHAELQISLGASCDNSENEQCIDYVDSTTESQKKTQLPLSSAKVWPEHSSRPFEQTMHQASPLFLPQLRGDVGLGSARL